MHTLNQMIVMRMSLDIAEILKENMIDISNKINEEKSTTCITQFIQNASLDVNVCFFSIISAFHVLSWDDVWESFYTNAERENIPLKRWKLHNWER